MGSEMCIRDSLRRYKVELSSILQASNTTKSRFLRLLILALVFVLILFPLQIYVLFLNWPEIYVPYSWSQIHDPRQWNQITFIPSHGTVLPDRWIVVGCGALVFILLGLGKEAKATYKLWLYKVGLGQCFTRLSSPRWSQQNRCVSPFNSRARLFGRWSRDPKEVEDTRSEEYQHFVTSMLIHPPVCKQSSLLFQPSRGRRRESVKLLEARRL